MIDDVTPDIEVLVEAPMKPSVQDEGREAPSLVEAGFIFGLLLIVTVSFFLFYQPLVMAMLRAIGGIFSK